MKGLWLGKGPPQRTSEPHAKWIVPCGLSLFFFRRLSEIRLLGSEVKSLSRVWLFATPWTVAYQAPSMGFSRQEYWSGLPFPSPGDLPDPGIEPRSPELQADALLSEPSNNTLNSLTDYWANSLDNLYPYWSYLFYLNFPFNWFLSISLLSLFFKSILLFCLVH